MRISDWSSDVCSADRAAPARRAVQVGLWERGKLTVYPPATGGRLPVAPEIMTLLDKSPPETAVPLPGTPWEVDRKSVVQGTGVSGRVDFGGRSNVNNTKQ